jgi:hypothetical protein
MRDDPRNYLNYFPEPKNRQNNHAEKQWHKPTQVYVEHLVLSRRLRRVAAIRCAPSWHSDSTRIAACFTASRSSSVRVAA